MPCLRKEYFARICISIGWITLAWRLLASIAVTLFLYNNQYSSKITDISVMYSILSIITHVLLLHGIHRERPNLMLPYLVLLMFEMIAAVYCLFFGIALLLTVHFTLLVPTAFVILGFYMYMWMMYVKLYHSLEIQQEMMTLDRDLMCSQ